MAKTEPCSQYDGTKICRSGWPAISGICFGVVHIGCKVCGAGNPLPPCMKDEPPKAFLREDGKPIFWPDNKEESNG